MGGGQSVLPVSHVTRGGLTRGGSKLSTRERVLVSLTVLLGGVWGLTLLRTGNSQLSRLFSGLHVQQQAAPGLRVDPRSLSDASVEIPGYVEQERLEATKHGVSEERLERPTHSMAFTKMPRGQPPNTQPSMDGMRGNSVQNLETIDDQFSLGDEVDDAHAVGDDAAILRDALPRQPATVAELVDDVDRNGQPSLRKDWNRAGLLLYSVVEEHNLTTAAFTRRYGQQYASQPVKIKDSQTDWWKPEDWTLEAVRREVGSLSPYRDLKRCKKGGRDRKDKKCHRVKVKDSSRIGKSWAGMVSVDLDEMGISTYNQLFDKQIELAKDQEYIYAQEVGPRWLFDFVTRLHQPKYFMNNIGDVDRSNHPDPREYMADNLFPAFFFGPAGSQSPLHTDASMTRFWILELTGTKLIRLIPPSNNWRADATDQDDFQPELFTADIMIPDFDKHPHLRGMIVYETLLEPGDILFIPEGWAHQALNLNWTCMASYNYNDQNNLQNRQSYYHYDKNSMELENELKGNQFYLPLTNMSTNVGNKPILEYFRGNALEYAEVSDAARAHIGKLKRMELDPPEWNDFFSTPVLEIAITHNYLALAKWLVEEGVPLENDSAGRRWLKGAESNLKLEAMAKWMREHMGVDAADNLSDVEDER